MLRFWQCGRDSWLQCGSVDMGVGGVGLPLGLGLASFGDGLGWLLVMVIGLMLDDGGFIVKDRARSEAGIGLGDWETCELGPGRSSSLFLIELREGEVIVAFLDWARVLPGMFVDCDEDHPLFFGDSYLLKYPAL